MAKALVGFMGGTTNEQLRQSAGMRRRISDLEAEVMRLKAENDGLNKALSERVERLTSADLLEPLAH
ncbi:MAG: hypothetical protein ACXWXF_02560 [Aeromicrobium sp.]